MNNFMQQPTGMFQSGQNPNMYGPMNTPYFNYLQNIQNQYQQNQPQMPQQQFPNQLMPAKSNKIFVSGIEEVRQYPLGPGSDMIFLHNDEPIAFEKFVYPNGQFAIKTIDLSLREDDTTRNDQFVSVAEFNALKAEFDKLKNSTNTTVEVVNEPPKA